MKDTITTKISEGLFFLDGAMGTELQKAGMPSGVCPEKWGVDNSAVVRKIHEDYLAAGSDAVFTCTFGGSPFKLNEYNIDNVETLNRQLARIAREAAGEDRFVLGDIGPIGKFISPFGELSFEAAVNAFKRQVTGLLAGGVDGFVIETMMDIQEARAALIAVKELSDLFTLVSMTFEPDGRTLNGNSPESAIVTLQSLGADAVGCNCSMGPREMADTVKSMLSYAKVPVSAKPNAGMPKLINKETIFPLGDENFAAEMTLLADAGADILGGCCGTSPGHIRKMTQELQSFKKAGKNLSPPESVSSAKDVHVISGSSGVHIIGERINPTGKKKFAQSLRERDFSKALKFARDQETQGASLLDVNGGVPGEDESDLLTDLVLRISRFSRLPLVIDSAAPEALEAALRIYPGRALINSVSGESGKTKKTLKIAQKYGAACIILPVTDSGVPETPQARCKAVEQIISSAEETGIPRTSLIADPLVMAVSSSADAGKTTLETITEIRSKCGVPCVAGLSNVSFGLPGREVLNAAFLSMAADRGLNYVIANPGHSLLTDQISAVNLLLGKDPEARYFIARNSGTEAGVREKKKHLSPEEALHEAVLDGDRDSIERVVQSCLKKGTSPKSLLENYMVPAIIKVGDLYDKKVYFLPQLMASAETMKLGFSKLKPMLSSSSEQETGKTIICATVEGDIHDIGKNIVTLMLSNYGFNVIDLGKDVSAENILEAAKRNSANVICLSALMTTTMGRMEETIRLFRKHGLDTPFMLGGAVVTEDWAKSIGASYSEDGVGAVRLAQNLTAE
ncbi:MAG: homocysteine S-methyltransferase family protein [Spirochaetia bacterium]